jgi:mannosylglycerate hydrolase
MTVTKPLPAPPLATLHVIPHLRWVREWVETFDSRRAWLLDTLARLLEQMDKPTHQGLPLRYFLLGGQTSLLEDVVAVRPDLLALLVIFNAGGRLGVGPFYTLVDDSLVSGESLLRNLLAARADAVRHGLKMMPVAYLPETSGHSAQLPQILRGVGITAAFLHYPKLDAHEPFRWEGLDGGSLLVVNHPPAGQADQTLEQSFGQQKMLRPDGPYLWLADSDSLRANASEMLSEMETLTGVPVEQSDLLDYLRALRRALPDSRRKPIKGELTSPNDGTYSARIYLKQMNARLQARLTYQAEPYLALALTHGNVVYPDNLKALLNHSWRLTLQNQARMALAGAGIDAVHEENEIRARQAEDTLDQVVKGALTALPGHLRRPNATPIGYNPHVVTYVMVWNAHNWPIRQVVEADLHLPKGYHPARLRAPGAEEQTFGWSPVSEDVAPFDTSLSGTITFLAEVPAVGYAVYTIELSDAPPDSSHFTRRTQGRAIGSVNGDTLRLDEDGRLEWQVEGATISDLLNFYDGGDAGDTFTYVPPQPDVIVKAQMVDNVQIESSPLYERLVMQHRMRIANSLRADRGRDRGVKLLELTTTATFYDHVPGVYFHTTLTNSASGMRATSLTTNGVFGLVNRPLHGLQMMQTAAVLGSGQRSIGLLARGLPEIEPMSQDEETHLALTLVRAVGWLSRDDVPKDIRKRPTAGPMLPVLGAQMHRTLEADYALISLPNDDPCAVIRAALEYEAPLQAFQYDARPERPRRSFLSIVSDRATGADSDGEGAILTALKPPQKGKGWIIRLLNPTEHPVEVLLTPHVRPENVQLMTLSEDSLNYIESDGNGRSSVRIEPQQLVTVKMAFE